MTPRLSIVPVAILMLTAFASALVAQPVTIDFVTVGDAGNAPDTRFVPTGLGGVNYEFQIGKFEISNTQYAAYLNAVAKSDPYMLYWGNTFGIDRSGTSGSYVYTLVPGRENWPLTHISYPQALRFVNWLHNGQPIAPSGAGVTETGAYTFFGPGDVPESRNPDARFFIPNHDEWYKSAFYKGGGTNAGYWTHATQSDDPPTSTEPPGGPNSANYDFPYFPTHPAHMTDVGAYLFSPGPYGTFDQAGSLFEWFESPAANPTEGGDDHHFFRGGFFNSSAFRISAAYFESEEPGLHRVEMGFRVAAVIPEPAATSIVLLVSAALRRNWQRRAYAAAR